jgi:maltose O-acetyltransferase
MRSEKEKMIAGEHYDPNDESLVNDRRRARMLLRRLNSELDYADVESRAAVLGGPPHFYPPH